MLLGHVIFVRIYIGIVLVFLAFSVVERLNFNG